jgi:hypothetical protein
VKHPEILRDILRAAADKHAANDDTTAFERVVTAARGLRPQPGRREPTRAYAVLAAQLPTGIRWNETVRKTILDLTPKHMRSTPDD